MGAPDFPPIRICNIVLSLQAGGLENGVVNVINGLDPGDFQSSVVCLREVGEFAGRIKDPKVEIVRMGLKQGNDPMMPLRLARALRALRPHIVHTRNIEAFFYGATAARLARVPHLIHSEHGRTFPETALRARVQRMLLRFADRGFAVSEQLRNDLIRHIGVRSEQFEVLYNGVDIDKFSGTHANRSSLQGGTVRIGSVGRLVPVKDYPLLLNALSQLPAQLPWACQLIGEGPERERLRGIAEELGLEGRVEFLGHRDDVAQLLKGLDIFVLPSISEGMSNTLLEAMAGGAAVVASRVGGNPEIVEDGRSGLLFPSGDAAALAAHLLKLVVDVKARQALAGAAIDRIRSQFSMTKMIERYSDLYRRVVRGRLT